MRRNLALLDCKRRVDEFIPTTIWYWGYEWPPVLLFAATWLDQSGAESVSLHECSCSAHVGYEWHCSWSDLSKIIYIKQSTWQIFSLFSVLSTGCLVILPPLLVIALFLISVLLSILTKNITALDVCIQTLQGVSER